MRFFLVFLMSLLSWGSDAALRAYVTSVEFDILGLLYAYDFNKDGAISNDEYLLLKEKRLYHIDLKRGFDSHLVRIDLPVDRVSFAGYIAKDSAKEFYLLLCHDGGVSRLHEGGFKALESDLSYEIENDRAAVVYKKFAHFKNIVASFDTPGFAWSLSKEGDTLLIADGKEGILALNEDLNEPLWSYKVGGAVFCVLPLGQEVYALGTSKGLDIVQKRDFKTATHLFDGRYVSKLLDMGESFLALVEHEGLYRIGKSDFEVQKMGASLNDPQDVVFDGGSIIVADGNEGLAVLSRRTKKLLDRTDLKAVVATERYIATLPWQSDRFLLYDRVTKKVKEIQGVADIENIVASGNILTLLYKTACIDRLRVGRDGKIDLQKRVFLPYPATDVTEDESFFYVTIGGGDVLKVIK